MTRWQRLGASPPVKRAGEKEAASQPHRPYFIGQTVGGVFDRNPAKELGEGKAEDLLADLALVGPVH